MKSKYDNLYYEVVKGPEGAEERDLETLFAGEAEARYRHLVSRGWPAQIFTVEHTPKSWRGGVELTA